MKRLWGYSRVVANAFQRKWKLCITILLATILLETMTIILGGYRFSPVEEQPEDFIIQYEAYCERSLLPRGWYIMPGPSSEIIPVFGNPNDSVKLTTGTGSLPPNQNNDNVLADTDVVGYGAYRNSSPPSSDVQSLCSCISPELGKCT